MRYFSKQYKEKITRLIHLSKANDLPLAFVIDVLKGRSDIKQDKRTKGKDFEHIVWHEVSISDSCVAFPLDNMRGKRLNCIVTCLDLEDFYNLEKYYGQCPEAIEKQVVTALLK